MTKILVVGAGVVGCSVARELSRFDADITVVERCFDVCEGTSKANSGIVHAGFDAEPNTNKAKFNVSGNAMFDKLSEELEFPFVRNGAMVLCFDQNKKSGIDALYQKGLKNGVKGLSVLSGDQARKKEPNLSNDVVCALYAQTSGIASPYEMTLAFGENALLNGVKFVFGQQIDSIKKTLDGFEAKSKSGQSFFADVIVNCAGLFADEINNMVNDKKYHIVPRKGEYILLDKVCKGLVESTIFQQPTQMGKGVLVTPTTHGNILVGPTAVDINDKDDLKTTAEGLTDVLGRGKASVPSLNKKFIITQFAGNRAHEQRDDFVVGWAQKGFFNLLGIESPGLTSAPALAVFAATQIAEEYKLAKNTKFNPRRKDIPHLAELSREQCLKLIQQNPLYAKIVCRCENVSEGEILDSINRPIGAHDLDGVKRRTRAGMGRCQSGFCSTRVMEILSNQLNIPITQIKKNSLDSFVVVGKKE